MQIVALGFEPCTFDGIIALDAGNILNWGRWSTVCRNIKTLYNFDPPATDEEIRASALQFVRKLSGFNAPSAANREAFERAIERVTTAARELIDSLQTSAKPRNREVEAAKAKARFQAR